MQVFNFYDPGKNAKPNFSGVTPSHKMFLLNFYRNVIKTNNYITNILLPSVPLYGAEGVSVAKKAINPIPISIALSSILKVGVCTPLVIPFALLPAPILKKQPGIW